MGKRMFIIQMLSWSAGNAGTVTPSFYDTWVFDNNTEQVEDGYHDSSGKPSPIQSYSSFLASPSRSQLARNVPLRGGDQLF